MSWRNNFFAYLATVFLALSLVILSTQTAFANKELDKHNKQGVSYFNDKNYEDAIKEFTLAINIEKKALYYDNRGSSYSRLDNYAKAIENYTEAINLEQNNAVYRKNRARSYFKLGKYDDALTDYKEAIKLNPNYTEAYNNLVKLYRAQGNNEAAEATSKTAKTLEKLNADGKKDEESPELLNLRGWSYYYLQEYGEALKDFNKAIALKSDYAEAYSGLASVYKAQGSSDDAAKKNFL